MKKTFFLLAFIVLTIFGFSQSRSFTGKPIYQILTKRAGVYLGTTTVELFPNIAPMHVSNFDSLVSFQFYDSTAFHRVIPGFMIQGGDPNSRHGDIATWGNGDPSQPTVNAEFSAAKHLRGILSAARDTSINSANSQFFICVAPAAWLNGLYTVYGHVTSGMNIVDTIVNAPRDINDNPYQKIEMFITYIGSNDTVPNAPLLNLPVSGSASASTVRALKWFAESDGIIYHVEVSTDSLFSTFYKSVDVGTNAYTVTGLSASTRYYWRIRTNNGGHFSTYSTVWNFLISGTGIDSYKEEDQVIVYPNPSNGQFVFENLEKENTIEIFDITGRSILKTLVKNTFYKIDLSNKAKGFYFYSITYQNKKVQQGKIIIQ
ncbi:MAG: peptidylprolyl isomerase [Bacteroidetes bacterium]|nr:peptidylprolyl isomerase [Bacteroidota bacterium]